MRGFQRNWILCRGLKIESNFFYLSLINFFFSCRWSQNRTLCTSLVYKWATFVVLSPKLRVLIIIRLTLALFLSRSAFFYQYCRDWRQGRWSWVPCGIMKRWALSTPYFLFLHLFGLPFKPFCFLLQLYVLLSMKFVTFFPWACHADSCFVFVLDSYSCMVTFCILDVVFFARKAFT